MKRAISLVFSLFFLLLPMNSRSSISIAINLTYECDNIWMLGDLSIKEFIIAPSENCNSFSSHDIAVITTGLIAKNICLQSSLFNKKDLAKVELLNKQKAHSLAQIRFFQLEKRKTELMIQKEKNKQAALIDTIEKNNAITKKELRTLLQKDELEVKHA